MRLLLGAGFAGVVFLAFGCTVDPQSGTDRSSSSELLRAPDCEDFAQAYCGRLEACAPGFFFPTRYQDRTACEAIEARRCALKHSAPGVSVAAASLGDCVSATANQTCASVLAKTIPAECGPRGTLVDGMACGDDTQCATGFCNYGSSGCGVCAPAPARGERCRNHCGPDDVCGGGFNAKCFKRAELGESCGADANTICRFGLNCVDDRCVVGLTEGARCRAGTTDGDPVCDNLQGLSCNGFAPEARCVKPRVVELGVKCGFNDYQTPTGLMFDPAVCGAAGRCPLSSPGEPLFCAARGVEGSECDSNTPDSCVYGLICRAGSCTFANPALCSQP